MVTAGNRKSDVGILGDVSRISTSSPGGGMLQDPYHQHSGSATQRMRMPTPAEDTETLSRPRCVVNSQPWPPASRTPCPWHGWRLWRHVGGAREFDEFL